MKKMARTNFNLRQASDALATDLEVSTAVSVAMAAHKSDSTAHPIYDPSLYPVKTVNSKTGNVIISKTDLGLFNVDNTTDLNKPISTATQNSLNTKVNSSLIGAVNGIASLDLNGKVPSTQLPSYVDDVLEYANVPAFPIAGETGKIYIALDTGSTYRWAGTIYAAIISGAVTSVSGKTGSVSLTKADVGLNNVDNTSDINKPISTLQQTAITAAENNAKATSTPASHAGATGAAHGVVTAVVNGFMSSTDKAKLDGVSGSNTGDETITTIKNKLGVVNLSGNNTGDQTDIPGNSVTATRLQTGRNINGVYFDGTNSITINAVDATARVAISEKGVAYGVASLDATGKVYSAQLPSYVDDVLEYVNLASFPATGESGKIYVDTTTNKTYRWSGTVYTFITSGAVDSVNGKTGVVVLTKADLGLGNVDNISDVNKPISSLIQGALDNKISWSDSGTPSGVASLDADSKLLYSQLPIRTLITTMGSLTSTSLVPYDNTTPLVTEGTEILTATMGASSTTGKLHISGSFNVDCGTANRNFILSCFKGSVCIGSMVLNFITAARPQVFSFDFYDPNFGTLNGTTGTYSLRLGVNSAATWYVNRSSTLVLNGMNSTNRPVRFEEIN